jgi:hypothetical protein
VPISFHRRVSSASRSCRSVSLSIRLQQRLVATKWTDFKIPTCHLKKTFEQGSIYWSLTEKRIFHFDLAIGKQNSIGSLNAHDANFAGVEASSAGPLAPVNEWFWQEKWTTEIDANILWDVRDIIDIPATLAANEAFYRVVWVTFARNTWLYCGSVAESSRAAQLQLEAIGVRNITIQMENESLRDRFVYPHVAAVNVWYFAGELDLEKMRMSADTDAESEAEKRGRTEFLGVWYLGKRGSRTWLSGRLE